MVDRRTFSAGLAAFSAALAIGPRSFAQTANLKPVRIGVGLKAMGPSVINLLIGEVLGYNAAEGLTVKPMALGGNSNVQVATDRGDVDVGIGVPSYALPIMAKGEYGQCVYFYQYTYPYKWDVAVKPGSKAATYADLKGLNIGVSDFGGTEYPVTRNILKGMGIDPDKDVKWTAVGNGVQAGVALQRGAIDALAYYDTGFGVIDGAGIPLAMLPRPANLPMIGGQFLMALRPRLTADRAMLVGFGRSTAKASTFLAADAAAGARAFLKMYPETAPRGSTEEQGVKAVLEAVSRRIKLYEPPYPDTRMGAINPAELTTEAALNGFDVKDVSKYYTNDLIPEINDFDAAAIRASAKAYKA